MSTSTSESDPLSEKAYTWETHKSQIKFYAWQVPHLAPRKMRWTGAKVKIILNDKVVHEEETDYIQPAGDYSLLLQIYVLSTKPGSNWIYQLLMKQFVKKCGLDVDRMHVIWKGSKPTIKMLN